VGLERNNFGLSDWGAVALYARVQPLSWLYLAARVDRLSEHDGSGPRGTASPIFFPSPWVSEGTFTIEGRPYEQVSIRLEYRHDQAGSDLYFAGAVKGNGTTTPYVPNSVAQNTITAGATAWF
jgi:Putative beta-barrel porin-2, OmpL-like. bbp2